MNEFFRTTKVKINWIAFYCRRMNQFQLISDASSAALHEKPAGKKVMQTVVQWKNYIFCNLLSTTQDRIASIVFYKFQPARLSLGCKINLDNVYLLCTIRNSWHSTKQKLFDLLPVDGNRALKIITLFIKRIWSASIYKLCKYLSRWK